MKRIIIKPLAAMYVVAMFVIVALVPAGASAAANGIKVGDFWEYKSGLDLSGLNMTGNTTFGVTGNITVKILVHESLREVLGGSSQDVFRMNLTGGGDIRVSLPNLTGIAMNASGTLQVRGNIDRLQSNFSEVRTSTILDLELQEEIMGFKIPVSITFGIISSSSRALDDYIGDNSLAVGTVVKSTANTTTESWMDFSLSGGNRSNPSTEASQEMIMEVTRANVSVTVPAGTFNCWEVNVTTITNHSISTPMGHWFYSDKVGNYVKMENSNAGASISGFGGNLSLIDYSYKKGSAFSLTSPTGLAVIGLIAAVVIVAVVIALMRGRRRRSAQQPPTPPPAQ